ncbi:MAG TPA: hypothetical protein DDW49_07585 [Deltaproteobacteria bacterium]|nr:MAG: hypothetical protein A2048_03635 [Deltaproteobacteria bacterium GWA2_45_12]HBF13232.1 hypothetical protein [Deltaproteobacteria bacterium]
MKNWFIKRKKTLSPSFKSFNGLNNLSEKDLVETLTFSEEKEWEKNLPELEGKKVLFYLNAANQHLLHKISQKNPKAVYVLFEDGALILANEKNIYYIRSELKLAPLKTGFADVLIVSLASLYKEDALAVLEFLSPMLAHNGRMMLSVIHPFLEILLYNQNPAQQTRARYQLQDYLRRLRENDLYVETIKEGLIDKDLKPFLVKKQDEQIYHETSGIPLVLFLKAVKFVSTVQREIQKQSA